MNTCPFSFFVASPGLCHLYTRRVSSNSEIVKSINDANMERHVEFTRQSRPAHCLPGQFYHGHKALNSLWFISSPFTSFISANWTSISHCFLLIALKIIIIIIYLHPSSSLFSLMFLSNEMLMTSNCMYLTIAQPN